MTENLGGLFGGAALGNLNLASAPATEAAPAAEVEADATVHNVIIVGSGPAGYTAAIYAARAELKPVLFASSLAPGGALMNTTEVENFPGFIQGIQGPELMENIGQQAERFGAGRTHRRREEGLHRRRRRSPGEDCHHDHRLSGPQAQHRG